MSHQSFHARKWVLLFMLSTMVSLSPTLIPIEVGTAIIPIPIPETYSVRLQTEKSKLYDAQVVAGITEINIQQKLMFQFEYELNIQNRSIDFKFEKSPGQIAQLSIDFLVGKNITYRKINMTNFQLHVPYTNTGTRQETDILLLFANGFSRLDITGNITYLYIFEAQMYTVHYMSGNMQSQNNIVQHGWGDSFIYYTAVFVKNNTCKNCIVKQYFHLKDSQVLPPQGTPKFYALKGYSGNQFKAAFLEQDGEVVFAFDKYNSDFSDEKQVSIGSTFLQGNFLDRRQHRKVYSANKNSYDYLVFIILGLAGAVLITAFICFKLRGKKKLNILENNSQIDQGSSQIEPKQEKMVSEDGPPMTDENDPRQSIPEQIVKESSKEQEN